MSVRGNASTPASSGIPVPLASKFRTIPNTIQKGPLGGMYI